MRDYQNTQRRICQFQATPSQDESNEIGYTSLRQCHAEARTLLAVPYPPELLHPPSAPNEAEKRQLQRYAPNPSHSSHPSFPPLPADQAAKGNHRRKRPPLPSPENLPTSRGRHQMGPAPPIDPARTQAAKRPPASSAPGRHGSQKRKCSHLRPSCCPVRPSTKSLSCVAFTDG